MRIWDHTNSVKWSVSAILHTFFFLFVPEMALVAGLVWLYWDCTEQEFRSKLSFRNPVFLLFIVLIIAILSLVARNEVA
jgi:hypothetical protein